jgi:hypothetical protein
MNRLAVTCGFAAALFWSAVPAAEPPNEQADTVTVPLDQIWAYDMPGTRDVRELEPEHFGERVRSLPGREQSRLLHDSETQQIRQALPFLLGDKQAKPGFVVLGTDDESLHQAYLVLVKNQKPRSSFPVHSRVWLVFFSHQFGAYVHLQNVERQGANITIFYQFVPHKTEVVTEHFALIPLHNLPPGRFHVEVVQAPMDRALIEQGSTPVDRDKGRQVVCQPFSFSVEDRRDK